MLKDDIEYIANKVWMEMQWSKSRVWVTIKDGVVTTAPQKQDGALFSVPYRTTQKEVYGLTVLELGRALDGTPIRTSCNRNWMMWNRKGYAKY